MRQPPHLRILYRLSTRVHDAVRAAICEGCRCGVPSQCDDGAWFHYLDGCRTDCLAGTYRISIDPASAQDFKVFERAAREAGFK